MYNGRHISKRIAKLLVVIVVRRIIALGLEVLLNDAVPCLRPLGRNNYTNAKERGIENYIFVLPLTSFKIFFICIAQYGVILAELGAYELF